MTERYNLNPNLWGPHAWFFIDNVAFSYPKNPTKFHKELFKNFFITIGDIIPCHSCRIHFKQNLKKIPLTNNILSSRNKFIEWVFQFHNLVRKSQGKNQRTHTEIMKYYDNPPNTSNNNTNHILIFMLFVFTIIIIFLLIKKNKLKDI